MSGEDHYLLSSPHFINEGHYNVMFWVNFKGQGFAVQFGIIAPVINTKKHLDNACSMTCHIII